LFYKIFLHTYLLWL